MVIDFQGPFELNARLIDGTPSFAVVDFWPDVSVFITTAKDADDIIAAVRKAKALLPKKAARDA